MQSTNFRMSFSIDDDRRCYSCENLHGKIYTKRETIRPKMPQHPFCRCFVKWLKAMTAGTATERGMNGADWWLKHYGRLPDYYIRKESAEKTGWKSKAGNLAEKLPGRMIGGDEYWNKDGHLPSAPGRKWYEADIDFHRGRRGLERILYSNDGLIFVTYDHYRTFVEIV